MAAREPLERSNLSNPTALLSCVVSMQSMSIVSAKVKVVVWVVILPRLSPFPISTLEIWVAPREVAVAVGDACHVFVFGLIAAMTSARISPTATSAPMRLNSSVRPESPGFR